MTSTILKGISLHGALEEYCASFRGNAKDEMVGCAAVLMAYIEGHLACATPATEEERRAYLEFTYCLVTHQFFGRYIALENLERELQSEEAVDETQAVILQGLQLALGRETLRFPATTFKVWGV